MPHAIFLGSSLATLDRVSPAPSKESLPAPQSEKENLTLMQKINRTRQALFYVEPKPKGNPLMHTRDSTTGSSQSRESDVDTVSVESHSRDEVPATPTGRNHPVSTRKYLNNSLEFIKGHLGHAIVDIGEFIP
jgi:hypothetical protein